MNSMRMPPGSRHIMCLRTVAERFGRKFDDDAGPDFEHFGKLIESPLALDFLC
jgi:hypothetical protein